MACALLKGLYAPLLLRRPGRKVLLAGAAGNLAVVILWPATRTTGIFLFGPHAGEIEEIDVAEAGIVTGLGILAIRDLTTEGRLQIVVVTAASSLLFWHLLHLLGGSPAHY
jgi:hypothetical protein